MVEGDTDTVEFGALEAVLAEPGTQMRIFGKPEVHGHRRMAVVLATDSSVEEAQEGGACGRRPRGDDLLRIILFLLKSCGRCSWDFFVGHNDGRNYKNA